MARYETVYNTLIDFDIMQYSSLSPLSPVPTSDVSPKDSSMTSWSSSFDGGGGGSVLTSLSNASDAGFRFQHHATVNDNAAPPQQLTNLDLSPTPSQSTDQSESSRSTGDDDTRDGYDVDYVMTSEDNDSSQSSSDAFGGGHRLHPVHATTATTGRSPEDVRNARREERRARKRSPRDTAINNELPPCRICASAASGLHYGLNTCDSCKKFFQRSMTRKRNYKCKKGTGKCVIKGQKSGLCGHCRFQQCLALGMSKTAIKTGRYTHAKRAQDVQDMQRLTSTDLKLDISENEVWTLIQQLTAAHVDVVTTAHTPRAVMLKKLAEKREEIQIKRDVFGIEQELSFEQNDEIFRETGLDVGERRAHMTFLAKSLNLFIEGYVRFGAGVPGFSDLSTKDQANLLKLARPEIWLLGAYRGYMCDEDAFYTPNRDCRYRHEMARIRGKEYADCAFKLAQSLQDLDLSHEEVVVLKAVCLTFSDRCELEDRGKVEEIQWRMLRCLLYLLQHNHPEEPRMFHKVLDWTIGGRTLNELSTKAWCSPHFLEAVSTHTKLVGLVLL